MSDATTYSNPDAADDDLVLDVDNDAATDDVLEAGRYGEQGEAELFDISLKQWKDNEVDRNGVPLTYMELAVVVTLENGNKHFLRTGPFGRNTRTEKNTGSVWPRFATQLGIGGRKKSEIIPMNVVVDVGVRDSKSTMTAPDGTEIETNRRFNSILDIFPYQAGGA